MKDRLDRVLVNWSEDMRFVLFGVLMMLGFRLPLLVGFGNQVVTDEAWQYVLFMGRAVLFDLRVVLLFALPSVVLGLMAVLWDITALARRVREIVGSIFCVLSVGLWVVTVGYFYEYSDQFNYRLYGLLYDDRQAVMESIWREYPVIWVLLIVVLISWLMITLMKKVMRMNMSLPGVGGVSGRVVMMVLLLALMGVGLRGSIESRPLQREDIGVTKDMFLNKLVVNPYFALYYTRSDHKHLAKAHGFKQYVKDGDIRGALDRYFPELEVSDNLDDYFKRAVKGEGAGKPSHIFLIVLESQDAWPLLEDFQSLGLAPNLVKYGESGLLARAFISSGTSTRTTLNAIISGLPDASVYTNFQPRSQQMYPTAIANIMAGMGYQTRLFYGGHLTWQRLGEFAKNQGFDEVYGREQFPVGTPGDSWGVYDEELFQFIEGTVGEEQTFNLVMTTSNHSPYPVDTESLGCAFNCNPVPEIFKDSASSVRILSHLWYNDYCIGKFVEAMLERCENPLFVITGDHTSRRYFSKKPSLYETVCVPCIFYMPKGNLPSFEGEMVGSHLDIAPTLVELVGGRGYEYYTLGRDMLSESEGAGFGADMALTGEIVEAVRYAERVERMPWVKDRGQAEYLQQLRQRYDDLHGIAWWRIIKGELLN